MIVQKWKIALGVVAVLAVFAYDAVFVVTETQLAVVTRLGKPVRQPIIVAGLNFKIPFLETATFFEKRIIKWYGRPNPIPTKDKKFIYIDTMARWHIKDPLLFLQRVGKVEKAQTLVDGLIDSVVRDHVSKNYLVELVRSEGWEEAKQKLLEAGIQEYQMQAGGLEGAGSEEAAGPLRKGREKITREMLADGARLFPEYGMELLDIRITRINYEDSVQQKVFERMISERKRIAAQYRSEGEGERAAILGQMERELAKIRSEAYRESQQVRGRADAEATRIYAEAFSKNVEFFAFYRTLDFYQNFSNPRGVFVFSTDSEIFKYLTDNKGVGPRVKSANP
jgi:modulator of FtsH protease HflC